ADFEELEFGNAMATITDEPIEENFFSFYELAQERVIGNPRTDCACSNAHKDLQGYNIFLNDLENPVAENVTATQYLFEALAEGDYLAGVQSVYPTGTSDVVTLAFEMLHGVPVTIMVETNSGDNPNGAQVLLTSNENEQDTYAQVVGPDGQAFFHNVYKGNYTLQVSRDHFHQYLATVEIQDSLVYTVVLEEILAEPVGLEITTQGLEPGEALFSWSNEAPKALLEYTVYLNNVPVVQEYTETSYLFTGLPAGQHTAGVKAHYTTGHSQMVSLAFTIEEMPDLTKPVTFTVLDQSQTYQSLHIKGEMTTPQWEDVSLSQGPPHFWTVTLNVLPGTYQWGITEDDGTENGIWLLPEGENLTFTLHDDGSITGSVSYILTALGWNETEGHHFIMYPNPATTLVNIENKDVITQVQIIDVSGRVVWYDRPMSVHYQVQMDKMDRGIYFVHVVTSNQLIIHKLILQ
ncbi:MAG: T9SS type A sorting domain-containing protein, partial [Bacteroidota bacterium]